MCDISYHRKEVIIMQKYSVKVLVPTVVYEIKAKNGDAAVLKAVAKYKKETQIVGRS
jgi:hypothetical protein